MAKQIQLLLGSKGGLLANTKKIWEKDKTPIWIYYHTKSISKDTLIKLKEEIRKNNFFYCLVRYIKSAGMSDGEIHYRLKVEEIQMKSPSDITKIVDFDINNRNKAKFYMKIIYAEDFYKSYSDYFSNSGEEITGSHLRNPLLVIQKENNIQ